MRLIDADKLMEALRGNVLIDVTPEIEKTVSEQPTAFDLNRFKKKMKEESEKNVLITLRSVFKVAIESIEVELKQRR